MQKVEGSNPFSRSRKGPAKFGVSPPPSSPELLSPEDCLRTGGAPAATPDLKLGGFAGEFCSRRTVVILQPAQKAPGSDRRCGFTIESSDLELSSCSSPIASTCGANARKCAGSPERACAARTKTLASIGPLHSARSWAGFPVIVRSICARQLCKAAASGGRAAHGSRLLTDGAVTVQRPLGSWVTCAASRAQPRSGRLSAIESPATAWQRSARLADAGGAEAPVVAARHRRLRHSCAPDAPSVTARLPRSPDGGAEGANADRETAMGCAAEMQHTVTVPLVERCAASLGQTDVTIPRLPGRRSPRKSSRSSAST
jgi:hypothetical protein